MAGSSTQQLKELRACFSNVEFVDRKLDAYIVPYNDEHQSEYLAECDKRVKFICGFSGSSATVIVTHDAAFLWTDGRYFLQAESEIDKNWTLMKDGLPGVPKPDEWLTKSLKSGSTVGLHPFLVSKKLYLKYAKALKTNGSSLVAVASSHLVDVVWKMQPLRPTNTVVPLGLEFAGSSWQDKAALIRTKLKANNCFALVLTALDEIAWFFNLRGSDIDYNPVFFSYAIVGHDFVNLFIDPKQVSADVQSHLGLNGPSGQVKVFPYDPSVVQEQIAALKGKGKVWLSEKASFGLHSLLDPDHTFTDDSPIQLAKAVKNATEIQGMRNAHIRDAVALCEYLHWLETVVPDGGVDEVSVADHLDQLRSKQADFVSLSFPTISSTGPNGAVIHYRATEKTNRKLSTDEVYLVDSGAQFKDGTTDVTRTVHFGTPTKFQRECYTRVLKGHIGLAMAIFPNQTKGHQLDVIARQALWNVGLDYLHGTGHGVGSFLNVHEGPQSISPKAVEDAAIKEGMILSDEPGYYEDGSFGIRIENLVLVVQANTRHDFKQRGFLTFEALTLVPMQAKMIDINLLTATELEWLNSYHTTCREKVGEELKRQGKQDVLKWLERETSLLTKA
ncbi:xaa-Pro aminopeptidase 1-like [Corticium candelabrum]|uniref:xaa-Pro aminopeptidase 1-like n=1 Tax=Corticium candelabrum TaxID=121492 RepID=UPI002E253D30|nr:xaa-Pro aminopeptidase 1-like [Corticium candelabrum]